ncbi:MAG: DUF3859 domain-containing protein [Gammaproteobacteria bacterium]|nr:DUF3859 domain-containing protein [Gammaproteobacteria bacterium]
MKYLIPVALLLALSGCERNSPGSQNSAEGVATPESVASGNAPDVAEQTLKGHVGRAGLYRLVRSGGVIDDPSTSTGKSVLKPVVELVRTTDRIPLIKGGQMYLQFRIWPLPEQTGYADLRRVLKHPAMTLPDGSVSTGSDYMIKGKVSAGQAIGYTGYGLDEDYELVEGDWTFEIWYQDRKLIEQTFTTYRPDEEEVAKLKPILELGNRAVGQSEPTTGKPFSRFDWPRVVVGQEKNDANLGLSDLKQSLEDPLNQP